MIRDGLFKEHRLLPAITALAAVKPFTRMPISSPNGLAASSVVKCMLLLSAIYFSMDFQMCHMRRGMRGSSAVKLFLISRYTMGIFKPDYAAPVYACFSALNNIFSFKYSILIKHMNLELPV